MKGHFRLTVHVDEAEKFKSTTGKKVKNAKGKFENITKLKIFNTLSFYCKSPEACMAKLSQVRNQYKIAKGKDSKKMHKFDKELYNISFVY